MEAYICKQNQIFDISRDYNEKIGHSEYDTHRKY